jgi:Zn-finger nucleic acid-binding protein
MVSSLNCPSCGAPAPSADAARCEYCGSALTVTACPSCFGPMFAGMQFCPHCGAKGERVVDEDAAAIACPGCKTEMHAVRVGATSFHECPSCAGSWLVAEAFTQLCTSREDRGSVAAMVGPNEASVKTVLAAVRYVQCPVCKKTMNRQNFGRRSGVVIDVCKGHGVWFDHGELQSVLAFVDAGGLEKARRAEHEREQHDQKQLDQTMVDAMIQSARAGGGGGLMPRGDSEGLLTDALRALFS